MRPRTRNTFARLSALGLAVLASACGSNDSELNSPAPGGSSSTAGASTSGAAAADNTDDTTDGAGSAGKSANSAGSGGSASGSAGAATGTAGAATGTAGTGPATGPGTADSKCKRGVAYGHHSVADLKALSAGVSWWYNWDFRPDTDLRAGAYLDAGVEYAPMIWGTKSDRAAAKKAIGDDARVLLGFNEPNFGSQANLSAQAAAALWPELEAIADEKGLRLVSPAVNFCGGDCQDTDPFHYLDAFFAACAGCRVDAVALHIYVGCSPSGDNKAQWLIDHVKTYKSRFSQPLWLTEFACDSAKNDAEQQAFLEDAVAYLEAEPRIERYAWFSGRATNVPHVDLLGSSGQLTALGQAYVNAPVNAACKR